MDKYVYIDIILYCISHHVILDHIMIYCILDMFRLHYIISYHYMFPCNVQDAM